MPRKKGSKNQGHSRSLRSGQQQNDNTRSYDGRRRTFTKFIKDANVEMKTTFQAKRFIDGMLSYESKAELLSVLDDTRYEGHRRLRDIIGYVSIDNVDSILIPLLRSVVNEETNRPLNKSLRNRVLMIIFTIQPFMEFISEIAKDDSCVDYQLSVILSFVTCLAKTFVAARQSCFINDIAFVCRERGIQGSTSLCSFLLVDEKCERFDRGNAPVGKERDHEGVCWVSDVNPPGGRHNNDYLNFRDVLIVPTLEELTCNTPPWLPLANCTNAMFQDLNTRLLDKNFRLLREDAIISMKESLKSQLNVWKNARVIDIEVGDDKRQSPLSFVVQMNKPSTRKIDWERSRCLPVGGIVALCNTDKVLKIGTITKRDCSQKKEWLLADGGPKIAVLFDEEDSFDSSLNEAGLNIFSNFSTSTKEYDLIELSRSFFSYKPILGALQNMSSVPFPNELIECCVGKDPTHLPLAVKLPGTTDFNNCIVNLAAFDLDSITSQTSLDTSQARALHHALTSRVALIQGPPGTGKTFIGALLARIIRQNSNERILCVCYTNHALDQFLEHLYESGEREMVRVGGRSKSDIINKYQINDLARTKTNLEREVYFRLKCVLAELRSRRQEIKELMEILSRPLRWESPNGGAKSLIRENYPDLLEQFMLPATEDGFKIVGKKNKTINESDLFDSWCKGEKFPLFLLDDLQFEDKLLSFTLWNSCRQSRDEMINLWREELLVETRTALHNGAKRYAELFEEKQKIQQHKHRLILKDAKVVGATTTGAALNRDILESCNVGVVIVEEAGEVFESHILSAISHETKHLIMIGDHLQLRPKPESYKLTCSSKHGFNLDKSLFERLITSDLPSSMLEVQHRMRPEISLIVRNQTYPTLKDHSSVLNYPSVRAVTKNIVFLDHSEEEDKNKATSPSDNHKTKRNQYESLMVVEIARYLLFQGYDPSQIVILTPYVGQLLSITHDMKRELTDIEAYVSEMDRRNMDDIDDEGLTAAVTDSCKKNVRVAAIDNFQGEEADIIIISMVRSNKYGDIGFLKEKQRINVLFSRARHGMFIVGNASTFRRSSKGASVWEPLIQHFEKEGLLFPGLPTICQNHIEDEPVMLCKPCEFRKIRPNGGCSRPCTYRMECGHVCPQACHVLDQSHKVTQSLCSEPCRRFPEECNNGHPCPKLCKEECGPCRARVASIYLPCGHLVESPFCHDVRNNEAIKELASGCRDKVLLKFDCGHQEYTTCHNSRNEKECPALCGLSMDCGHTCQQRCGQCKGNHLCKMTCERELFCGHRCGNICHFGEKCTPCKRECSVKCAHSRCAKSCFQTCASCVEPCEWQCEHEARCKLVCGAPCSRLPCNIRCSKKLSCGHQCPSLCGEPCPKKIFCQLCASDTMKNRVVDVITMDTYEDVSLDKDPVIILPCGHFFQVSTMDGIMELHEFYEIQNINNFVRPRNPSQGIYSGKPKTCPDCRGIIHSIYRYGRVLRYHELRVLERKHNMLVERRLYRERSAKNLVKVEKFLKSGPMMKVYEACGGSSQVEVKPPDSRLLVKVKLLLCDAFQKEIEESLQEETLKKEELKKTAHNYCTDAIELARNSNSLRSLCEGLLASSSLLLCHSPPSDDRNKRIIAHLNEVLDYEQFADLREKAQELKRAVGNLTKKELESVINAVHEGYRDEALFDYGGNWSDHWFECPNGHPYFIGECGGAMEQSNCPECNAVVGGTSHTLVLSNTQASGMVGELVGSS